MTQIQHQTPSTKRARKAPLPPSGKYKQIFDPEKAKCPSSPTGAHHWRLSPPTGPISIGTCRWCAAKREFYNYVVASYNDRDTTAIVTTTGNEKIVIGRAGRHDDQE